MTGANYSVAELVEKVRWLRGRALIERDAAEVKEHTTSGGIIVPDRSLFDEHADRRVTVHRGTVLALGPPPTRSDVEGSPEVPWDCSVGDEVIYVYAVTAQKVRTFDAEGAEIVVVHAAEIQGVVEA